MSKIIVGIGSRILESLIKVLPNDFMQFIIFLNTNLDERFIEPRVKPPLSSLMPTLSSFSDSLIEKKGNFGVLAAAAFLLASNLLLTLGMLLKLKMGNVARKGSRWVGAGAVGVEEDEVIDVIYLLLFDGVSIVVFMLNIFEVT